jgi:N-acetylglucosaminyldiphosphoundecaprenol N-acetyl-beta-D-mannosaminyltransferase
VALLGSREEVASSFRAQLEQNGVVLAYAVHGDARTWDTETIAAQVDGRGCDVVLIALGAPLGEPVGQALSGLLPKGLIVGVGGAVEMATDHMPGAPAWVGRIGLEWAYRLVHEPRRMWRRYLVESPRAMLLLLQVLVRT